MSRRSQGECILPAAPPVIGVEGHHLKNHHERRARLTPLHLSVNSRPVNRPFVLEAHHPRRRSSLDMVVSQPGTLAIGPAQVPNERRMTLGRGHPRPSFLIIPPRRQTRPRRPLASRASVKAGPNPCPATPPRRAVGAPRFPGTACLPALSSSAGFLASTARDMAASAWSCTAPNSALMSACLALRSSMRSRSSVTDSTVRSARSRRVPPLGPAPILALPATDRTRHSREASD
jgi:hypothetical protein